MYLLRVKSVKEYLDKNVNKRLTDLQLAAVPAKAHILFEKTVKTTKIKLKKTC